MLTEVGERRQRRRELECRALTRWHDFPRVGSVRSIHESKTMNRLLGGLPPNEGRHHRIQ